MSMLVDAEHGPLTEMMLKEDGTLVLDAGSVGEEHDGPPSEKMVKEEEAPLVSAGAVLEENFAPVLKKPGKENQDTRLPLKFNIM